MKVVIKEGGNNQWLSRGAPHLHVRRDFKTLLLAAPPLCVLLGSGPTIITMSPTSFHAPAFTKRFARLKLAFYHFTLLTPINTVVTTTVL
jgi:hypothetical protein